MRGVAEILHARFARNWTSTSLLQILDTPLGKLLDIEHFHVMSHIQNWAPFWCTALNFVEAGLPPYETAVEHRGHRCRVGWKRRQMAPRATLKRPLVNIREAERYSQNLTIKQQAIRKSSVFQKVDMK